jgi:hypothetical protein
MRAILASWKDRLPSALGALAVQAAFVLLLTVSYTVVRRVPEPQPEVIYLLPQTASAPPLRDPMIIDARPRAPRASTALSSGLPPGGGNSLDATPRAVIPPPAAPPPPQAADRTPDCRLYPPKRSPLCPPLTANQGRGNFNPDPPSGVEDEKRWAAERARSKGPTDVTATLGPNVVATPRGIAIVIPNPLCRLARLLLGGENGCEPANYVQKSSEAQVQAALDAVNRRRGVIRKPALASAKTGESGNEQDRVDGRGDGPELRPGTGAD